MLILQILIPFFLLLFEIQMFQTDTHLLLSFFSHLSLSYSEL